MPENDLTAAVAHLIGCGEAEHLAHVMAETFAQEAAVPSRDQLAAMAMQGWLGAYPGDIRDLARLHVEQAVDFAYRVADAMVARRALSADRPRVVCLCGSTRFANEFMAAQFSETIAGRIVLTVGCFPRKADGTWDRMMVSDEQKVALDALHLRKIEMADEVFVVNVGGYVGPSTANEIAHARKLSKPIRWLEPTAAGARRG